MEDRLTFLAEWYEPHAALLSRYKLLYYPKDGSVEMIDLKRRKVFLRRIKYDSLHLQDLFVGNRVNVFSRQLNLIGYGDEYTANQIGNKERTLILIKKDPGTKLGEVLELISSLGMMVTKVKTTRLTWDQAAHFYAEHKSMPFFNNLVGFVSSSPLVAMEVMGDECLSIWRKLLAPGDPHLDQEGAPLSLCDQIGTDFAHASDSAEAAAREIEFFFPRTPRNSLASVASCTRCTCCIIKPHAVSEGLAGSIINSIGAAGFEISTLQMFDVDQSNAEEFLEVYKGVITDYFSMVTELSSGPCLVLEICGHNIVERFRELCGPLDPEIARYLRPNTLRALYGKNKVKNAVHCTDLPEDGESEVHYFFKILDD